MSRKEIYKTDGGPLMTEEDFKKKKAEKRAENILI